MADGRRTADEHVLDVYDRTARDLYRYASRLTGGERARTQDLVQDTYVHLLERVRDGRIDPTTIEIGWLVTSCRQRFLDELRRRRRADERERRAGGPTIVGAHHDVPPTGAAIDALAGLSDEHRTVLVLRYVDDLAVADIARALDRSVRATESLLVRARAALRAAASPGEDRP